MISQADGARLMAAHERAMQAKHNRCCAYFNSGGKGRHFDATDRNLKEAERAFAALVATLIDENDR